MYLVTVACSIGATILLIAPVSMHRLLFRRHRMETLVSTAHVFALTGTLLLGIALAGVATIIFDAVAFTANPTTSAASSTVPTPPASA